jgi:UDP-GlcNAc3NAcA epimerase
VKIITIVGARPQFIKAAPVSRALRKNFQEILIHTGQHYDINMSQVFFKELNIPLPDYNLEVGSGTHAQQTGQILIRVEEVMIREKPDIVLVYGDTNSTLAGTLAASKLHIPVAHVEAGLRSFNMRMPEEQNRIVTDYLAAFLFCPTITGVKNLEKENCTGRIINTGDVMYDAVLYNLGRIEKTYSLQSCFEQLIPIETFADHGNQLNKIEKQSYFLATIHRAENTDCVENLHAVMFSFGGLDLPIIFPVHPRTKKTLLESQIKIPDNVLLVEPIGYQAMLYLTRNAKMVITDSGGLQKEACFLDVPCITVRDQSEWPETFEGCWNVLCKPENIAAYALRADLGENTGKAAFGDGMAAEKIAAILSRVVSE